MPTPPDLPTDSQYHDAVAVVHSPELVADQPRMRADAWAILMAERGRKVNLPRLSVMQNTLANARGIHADLINPAAGAHFGGAA